MADLPMTGETKAVVTGDPVVTMEDIFVYFQPEG